MEKYKPLASMRMMVYDSGLPQREVSARLGASPTYISTYMSRDTSPSISTFVKVAEVCGWKVQIVKDDRAVLLEA